MERGMAFRRDWLSMVTTTMCGPCSSVRSSIRPSPRPSAGQSPGSSGMTTTFPAAVRSVSRRMASMLRESGKRWLMYGASLPAPYHSISSSTDRRSLSGACHRK